MSKLPESSRVLIVEDHPMFRERLVHLVNEDAELTVCGEADNIRQAMEVLRRTSPAIAVVDLTLKGSSGLELVKNLKSEGNLLPVLVLSMHEESLYAERVLAAGAKGYLSKNETSDTVLAAIHKVLSGEVYLSPRMTGAVLQRLVRGEVDASPVSRLADREIEVFQLIGAGRTTREIAAALHLGVTTVDTYRSRIKEKLGLRNAAELQHQALLWLRGQQGSGPAL